MIGALWTGISGLSSQQQALDNESNNIANVNTVGFKASRISFADQMYQDRIGKGSKILDAEKLYTQGNLKLTGVNYDMALSGDGFFTVVNTRTAGAAETLYTRAGNFRMGDNGTLQDAAGNEVQGWAMTAIDSDNDVTSTNPNVSVFNTDYTKLLSSKIIRYGNYVETITAKATDYSSTSKSDSTTVFSGDGAKTKSSKISDIEEAIKDYTGWLQKLKDSPDASSSTSISQISQINFKTGTESVIGKDGDQIYVYIDGNKVSQNYIPTTASESFKTSLLQSGDTAKMSTADSAGPAPFTTTLTPTAENNTRYYVTISGSTVYYDSDTSATTQEILDGLEEAIEDAGIAGGTTGYNITNNGTTLVIDSLPVAPGSIALTQKSDAVKSYDVEASKIATYKALADKISQIPGLVATMVKEDSSMGSSSDVLESDDAFYASTKNRDMLNGIIQIKALVPGEEFIISEVGEVSGSSTIQGNYQTTTNAVKGSGIAALETSRDALAKLITGKQQDVYTTTELDLETSVAKDYTYGITIYDKEIDATIPIPNDGGTPPQALSASILGATSLEDIVDGINADPSLSKYVVARVVNEHLVVETLDSNYDVEFNGSLKIADDGGDVTITNDGTPAVSVDISAVANNTTYSLDINGYTVSYTSDLNAMEDEIVSGIESAIQDAIDNSLIPVVTGPLTVGSTGSVITVTDGNGDNVTISKNIVGNDIPLETDGNYSGRKGAGAEFIEIVNRVDQTASKDSLQLRLDTLGISDSAFGEFAVDSTGLITMKQDGAEFAVGQIAIAVFNNNRGLNPMGDNLLAKTNESGDPIYNLNNNKTAKVEGKTLELSTADLSESLVNLMVFQRAFEANAKSITTSDELLNTLINLKR